jgi:hypothetical protein
MLTYGMMLFFQIKKSNVNIWIKIVLYILFKNKSTLGTNFEDINWYCNKMERVWKQVKNGKQNIFLEDRNEKIWETSISLI